MDEESVLQFQVKFDALNFKLAEQEKTINMLKNKLDMLEANTKKKIMLEDMDEISGFCDDNDCPNKDIRLTNADVATEPELVYSFYDYDCLLNFRYICRDCKAYRKVLKYYCRSCCNDINEDHSVICSNHN